MTDLHVGLSRFALGGGNADFAQDLSRLKGSGEHLDKEIRCLDGAITLGAAGDELGIDRENGGGPVSCRIGVDETSADGALVAHLHVAKMSGGLRQQRAEAAQKIGGFDLKVRGHGADADLAATHLDRKSTRLN